MLSAENFTTVLNTVNILFFYFQGVHIQTLGTFTFIQKKLDIGNNKFILIQRPVFNISEKFAQNQALQYVKHHVPGNFFFYL